MPTKPKPIPSGKDSKMRIGAAKKGLAKPKQTFKQANEELKRRQENSVANRQLEAYEAYRAKILSSGGTGEEANAYARRMSERDKNAGFGYGVPERTAQYREAGSPRPPLTGNLRGYGLARGGKVCKMR